MPLTRKLITLGTSRAVILPKSWIEYYERTTKHKIVEVAIETNQQTLTITPIIKP